MSREVKPVVRSSDMKEEYKNVVVSIAQDLMNAYNELQTKEFEIAKLVRMQLHQEFQKLGVQDQVNPWSVAIGKNFVVSTDVKRGWYAHIYLKHSISLLVWKIN